MYELDYTTKTIISVSGWEGLPIIIKRSRAAGGAGRRREQTLLHPSFSLFAEEGRGENGFICSAIKVGQTEKKGG